MRILIANDDGVYSPGIHALAEVAQKFGEVRVVAPDVEMSSASHSITASRPISRFATRPTVPSPPATATRSAGSSSTALHVGSLHG